MRSILREGPRRTTFFLAAGAATLVCGSSFCFCLCMARSIFPASTGTLGCSLAVITFSPTATSASASCRGEPTKKLAATTIPTPTTSRLNTLTTVSVKRAIVPSLRGLADRRLDRNPLYPISGRLLAVPAADHEVFSGHHGILACPSRCGVDRHRVITGRQCPSGGGADGELYHAGGPASGGYGEALLTLILDGELATASEEADQGRGPRRPLDARLEVSVGGEVLHSQIDVDLLYAPVETQPVRGRVHRILPAHRDVLRPWRNQILSRRKPRGPEGYDPGDRQDRATYGNQSGTNAVAVCFPTRGGVGELVQGPPFFSPWRERLQSRSMAALCVEWARMGASRPPLTS